MIQGKLKRNIYFFGCSCASMINKIVPKNKSKIVFFSTTNLYDNSEALFHYLVKHKYNEHYKIVCAVKNAKSYAHIKCNNVKFVSVFRCLPHILTTRYLFYHNEMLAIRPSKKQIWVDFWHATTFKKINKMIDKEYIYDCFTYITATSEEFRPIFAEAFGCDLERVIINGHPRNDYLFELNDEMKKLDYCKASYDKVVMWMPTYRISYNDVIHDTNWEFIGETGLPIFLKREELEKLNGYLSSKNVLMFIKVHPAQKKEGFIFEDMSHIKYLYNETISSKEVMFYSLLQQMDVIITDYSSVFFDYLLLDRPIGFTVEDIDAYAENRGFVFEDPLNYMPGPKITDKEEFYRFIDDCLEGKDCYHEERDKINEIANYYKDNNNCKRILEFVGIVKDEK